MAYRATFVKSVQPIVITLASVVTNTATITAVDTANSLLMFNGWNVVTGGPSPPNSNVRIALTNATTITATSNGVATNTVRATVLEFFPKTLKSVQRGTITLAGATSNTATIAAVVFAKSTVVYCGQTMSDVSDTAVAKLQLTNATTVTAELISASGTTVISYEVWEWY